LEILDRIASNGTKPTDGQDLTDIGLTMTQTSLCGLGQTANIAIKSAMKLWPEVIQ
jgi:NADH:ubiquinone oxidoreductase subunit F (NADH-binding)